MKRGYGSNKLYFVKTGSVRVEIPLRIETLLFDNLNAGSCFCLYSAFH